MYQFPLRPTLILALLVASTNGLAAPGQGAVTGPEAAAKAELNAALTTPVPAPSAPVPAPTLENTSWLLSAYQSGSALVEPVAGPIPARFRFEAGRVAGKAGCNQIGGAYTLDGNKLSFKANMASTMMACPEPLMTQDQAVGAALVKVAGYRVDGELLELVDAAGKPLLRFLRLKPTPLVGQLWQLKGYNNGKQAMASAMDGTEVNLEFRDDGTLGGFDGCNRYMSGYTLEGEVLTIGPLVTTRMACKGPAGAGDQARAYAAALGTVTAYRIDGGELTLRDGAGHPAARYRVEEVPVVEVAPIAHAGAGRRGAAADSAIADSAIAANASGALKKGAGRHGGPLRISQHT